MLTVFSTQNCGSYGLVIAVAFICYCAQMAAAAAAACISSAAPLQYVVGQSDDLATCQAGVGMFRGSDAETLLVSLWCVQTAWRCHIWLTCALLRLSPSYLLLPRYGW